MRYASSASENTPADTKEILTVMSFLLKSPRLATGLVRFARQAKFAFRKRKIFPRTSQRLDKLNQTFVRSYTLAAESNDSQTAGNNIKGVLYQKSVSQIFFDIKSKGYTFKEDLNDACYSLESSTPFTVGQTTLLIRSCGHSLPLETTSDKLKLVKEIWDSFDNIGVNKTIEYYNALLDVYIELEHNFSIEVFLSTLQDKSIFPNLKTYKKLLHASSIQGNIETFQNILEHMKINFVHLDDGIFNTLILGYSLQGDFISARGILELMKEKELTLSSESYVNLALGYAKRGDIDKVKEIVDECKKIMMFSIRDYLEIAYTLAVNKHSEHFSTILDMIEVKKNFLILSTKIIHRLLHQNLDKEAFMVFALRDKLESVSLVHECTRMFLDHYVRFRKPYEILEITRAFREKGWTSISLAYCIKETLLRKNISECLNFLHILRINGHSLRVHYFYPILIKSHQFGNEEVLKIIRRIKKYNLSLGREAAKALNKFYDFLPGAEFDDLKKLVDAGLNKNLAAWKILDTFLRRENIDSAVKLVSTCPISYPGVFLPVTLASAFSKPDSDHGKFFHILYHLIHHIKVNKIKRQSESLEVYPIEYEQFMVEIGKMCDKTFILGVMEEMLKKKVPLTPYAGSTISKEFPCPEITDLVSKLSSPDFKLEFDETLLKRLITLEEPDQNGKIGEKNGWERLHEALERNEKVPHVMSIFEDLAQEPELEKDENHENIVKRLLRFLSLNGDVASTERVYRIGVRMGLIEADYYEPCLMALLVRGHLGDAVKRYYEGLKATKKSKGLVSLVEEARSKDCLLALNDLNTVISKIQGKKFAATQLLVTFAEVDSFKEMRRILKSKTQISKPLFSELCQTPFEERNVKFFEVMEKASRNTAKLDLVFLYNNLLKLYEMKGHSKKILELYAALKDEGVMKQNIQKVFLKFLKNCDGDISENL